MKVSRKTILFSRALMVIAVVALWFCYAIANNAHKEMRRLFGDTDNDLARFIDRIEAENLPHDEATKARINELLEEHRASVQEISFTLRAYDRFFELAFAFFLVGFVLSIVLDVVARRSKRHVPVN